jgi:hypothetical protein
MFKMGPALYMGEAHLLGLLRHILYYLIASLWFFLCMMLGGMMVEGKDTRKFASIQFHV